MKVKQKIILVPLLALFFFSCSDGNDDVVKTPNKDGSIETSLSTEHKIGYDLLVTQHKVWVKGNLDTTITRVDTLKNLGLTIEETSSGDEGMNGKKVIVPRDYEIYITVK